MVMLEYNSEFENSGSKIVCSGSKIVCKYPVLLRMDTGDGV